MKREIGLFLAAFMTACVGTTGGQVITFHAEASGPSDLIAGRPFAFDSIYGLGSAAITWHVVLTKATLHVGAVYLSQTATISGSQIVGCYVPGTYVGEVTSGVDVDLLSPTPTAFPDDGEGTTLPAASAQVWLTQGDVSTVDKAVILALEGTADDDNGDHRPFTASVTIGQNRLGSGTATAGANPICKQRIVSFGSALALSQGGTLHLTIDPRLLFVNVDFSELATSTTAGTYAFKDNSSDQPSGALYNALRSAGTLYTLRFTP
ncbi:MAG: hypothetical protein ABI461_19765 [Polyangiaceae bacterium]